jgi:hypothetical protein
MSFYFVDANGKRTEIKNHQEIIHGIGTTGGGSGKQDIIPEKLLFFVGTKEQYEINKNM